VTDPAEQIAAWIVEAGPGGTTFLTGAGVSTDSGIPDYRGPQGLWTRDPDALRTVTFDAYVSEPEVRIEAWKERMNNPVWQAEPNPSHSAIVELERGGWLRAVCTQNIDGLHQLAGSSPDMVLELHGTIRWVSCLSCDLRTPMPEVLERVREGEPDPACPECGGIQKSATIAFGQALDPAVLLAASAAARDCRLLVAVGTSLTVHPAAGLCEIAKEGGARLVIVNAQPTPYDALADLVVAEAVGEVLPAVAAQV
jgi:NAD-dependent deacetylase